MQKGCTEVSKEKVMPIYQDLMSKDYAKIAQKFRVNPDHCEHPEHYESFIRQDCFTDHKQGMGVTHVFVDEDEDSREKTIAGYITLRCSSLIMDSGGSYKLGYPALEISELAVDRNYERMGLGTEMVMFAIHEAAELNNKLLGIQYVILCADNAAVEFYSNSKLKFEELRFMQQIPREHRNSKCKPMMLKIVQNT